MKQHSHHTLRGHIAPDTFDPAVRDAWRRSSRYWEALAAHHAHCNDRPALIATLSGLLQRLERECSFLSAGGRLRILDVGCGMGEVSSQLLSAVGRDVALDYVGIDHNAEMLEAARTRLRASAGPGVALEFRQRDYGRCVWADLCPGADHRFRMIWLIHSGYYLTEGHGRLLEELERITQAEGLIVLLHNPEGNAPYREAAARLGMQAYAVDYEREVRLPAVSQAVFAALVFEPDSLDAFSSLFAATPGARELRLLLEFYLPDYPLEKLPLRAREVYVSNWERHNRIEGGRFANRHQMLVLLPRHQAGRFLLSALQAVF